MEPLQHNATRAGLSARWREWREQIEQWCAGRSGLVLQLAAPALSGAMFLRQPDYFAVTVCGAWLATNLYNVAAYIGDARARELPLVTVGDGECVICHDWGYMLGQLGLLSLDTTLAGLVRAFAFIVMWSSLAAGGWMLWRMARKQP